MRALGGLDEEENKKLYDEVLAKEDAGWGVDGRLTAYADAGVGLVKEIKKARYSGRGKGGGDQSAGRIRKYKI